MARSNRQLTQFAVNKVRQYLVLGPEEFTNEAAGNTRVSFFSCSQCERKTVKICLYGKKIMELVVNPLNPRVIAGMFIFSGDFYDSKGRPSRTTRERLNGLLDALGQANFIPEGVRVFIREDGSCCIGKGDACKQFDAGKPVIGMLSHPNDLVFA